MTFSSYHPALNALFFAVVIACAALWTHPVFAALAWLCALAYSVRLRGAKGALFGAAMVALACAWAAWFATHTHFGVTGLGETIIGNQVTVESLACGLVEGVRIGAVLMWLECLVSVCTADKVVFLLGRVSPRLSLLCAVAMRSVPAVASQAQRVSDAQKGVGRGAGQGSVPQRAKHLVQRVSTLISWSIERFVQTSDSMRSRGSALRGRTAYSLYRFDNRDRILVIGMFALITMLVAAALLDQTYILFDPMLVWNRVTHVSFAFYAAYAVFCLLPLLLEFSARLLHHGYSRRTQ